MRSDLTTRRRRLCAELLDNLLAQRKLSLVQAADVGLEHRPGNLRAPHRFAIELSVFVDANARVSQTFEGPGATDPSGGIPEEDLQYVSPSVLGTHAGGQAFVRCRRLRG